MSRSIRVAVVGVGALGRHHARLYSKNPSCQLVAVVDTNLTRAREVAAEYGGHAHQDFRQVMGSVDAISLAVPTLLHSQIGVEFLREGIHVLIEKPISHTLEAADELLEAQKKSQAILHVGHSERFNPAVTAVKKWITSPRFFEAHRLGVFVPRSLDIDVVLDLMIHDLDLILYLNRSPIREIRAVGVPVLTPRIDIANARIEFEGGCVANITASRVSSEKTRKLRLFQPNDYVSIDFQQQEAKIFSLVELNGSRQIIQRPVEIERGEPLAFEIQAFLSAIGGSSETSLRGCSGLEGRQALALALQLLKEMG